MSFPVGEFPVCEYGHIFGLFSTGKRAPESMGGVLGTLGTLSAG